MANKIKFKKENIRKMAFKIVHAEGPSSFNVRRLATTLNCSTQPIFSSYKNVEEIWDDILSDSLHYFDDYMKKSFLGKNVLQEYCNQMVNFYLSETHLFETLFGKFSGNEKVNNLLKNHSIEIVNNLSKVYSLNPGLSSILYLQNWTFALGLIELIKQGLIKSDGKLIDKMIEDQFNSSYKSLKTSKGRF
jgi:hypothetical protein